MSSFPKATELADLTSKISLLEDAKKKKEEEALQWQEKVGSEFLLYEKFSCGAFTVICWHENGSKNKQAGQSHSNLFFEYCKLKHVVAQDVDPLGFFDSLLTK